MMAQPYHNARFLLSVAELKQLPPDEGIEVAFAGRSNAGKSSALNAITQNRKLARTSKTPGRTQHINLFDLGDNKRLVDLPGYGYAKVPIATKQRWQKNLAHYLETRQCLKGLVLLMDIRHPLKPMDQSMLTWAHQAKLPVKILLTKADKLKRSPALTALQQVNKQLVALPCCQAQLFSAANQTGLDGLCHLLNQWFNF